MQSQTYSIAELAQSVNDWCRQHGVEPLHNRVGEEVTVRNIRYYQTLGLVSRPASSSRRGFLQVHRLQLIAIRMMQARGLPLESIRRVLQGRSERDLQALEERGLAEWEHWRRPSESGAPGDWQIVALEPDVMLLTRRGRPITADQRQRIRDFLNEPAPQEAVVTNGAEIDAFRPEID